MFDQWLKLPAHYYLRITALLLLVVGVTISNVLMSIGAIWIISNWLIEARFSEYGKRLRESREIQLILFFLAYSLISFIWSDDFWFAFQDMRIKLPLLAIPLAMGTGKPLEKPVFRFLLYVFIGIVVFASVFNYCRFQYFAKGEDIRQMSWFISQIRFAALVNLSFFTLIYLLFLRSVKWWLALPLLIWLGYYTFYAQVLNGYVVFVLLTFCTIFYLVRMNFSPVFKGVFWVTFFVLIVGSVFYLKNVYHRYKGIDTFDYEKLEFYSAAGNPYFHDTTCLQTENGHFVYLYVQQEELEKAWNYRSALPLDSTDKKGQPVYGTLVRYLTSKDLRKDSVGVWSLSEEDIRAVENGSTSAVMNSGLEAKLHAFFYQYELYKSGADPNGFSLLQRLEHLRIARSILAKNWVFGVGIGDMETVFQQAYEEDKSVLLPENRLRSHNQYLSSWIGLGIPGILVTVLWFVMPFRRSRKPDYFLLISILTLAVSFMFEDMLETQAGVTIFALFYSLAVFRERSSPEAH